MTAPTDAAAGASTAASPETPVVSPAPPLERRKRTVGWRTKDILRTATLVVALYIVVRLLWFANELVLAIFLGVLIGLALSAGVDQLERVRVPRGLGTATIVLAFFAVLFGLGALIAPTLRQQGQELRRRLPEAIERAEEWVSARQGGTLGMILTGNGGGPADSAGAAGAKGAGAAGGARAQQRGNAAGDTSQTAPNPLRDQINSQVGGVTQYLFPFLSSTLAVFAGLLLIFFVAVYTAADPKLYHRGLMHLFPHRVRPKAGELLSAVATVLRRWLVTQFIAMLVIGVVTAVILALLHVRAAYALGVIAGLLEFVPTVGPILSAVPAIAMGFLDSPEKALYVVIAYVGIQFLENHLLIPLLMKGGVDLPPVLTIVAQALMLLVFGFLGLMVAVPMLAAIMVPVKLLYVEGVVGDEVDIQGVPDDDDPDEGESPDDDG